MRYSEGTLDDEVTGVVVTALCNQPEAFASDLGDDQSRYLYATWLLVCVSGARTDDRKYSAERTCCTSRETVGQQEGRRATFRQNGGLCVLFSVLSQSVAQSSTMHRICYTSFGIVFVSHNAQGLVYVLVIRIMY